MKNSGVRKTVKFMARFEEVFGGARGLLRIKVNEGTTRTNCGMSGWLCGSP